MTVKYLGDKVVDQTVFCYFETYGADGESLTMSGLAVGDIEIYKDGGTTQRTSTNGFTLLDTDGTNFDGITGLHGFKIDLSDNSHAGFYAAGSHYLVRVQSITVNSQTVGFSYEFTIEEAAGAIAQLKVIDPIVDAILVDTATTIPASLTTIDNEIATIDGIVDAILVDTGTTIDGIVDAILVDTGTTIPALIAALDVVVDTVKAETALIVADTNELQSDNVPGLISTLDAVVDTVKADTAAILTDTGTTIPATITTVDTVVDAIKAVTDLLPDAGALNDIATILADTNELQVDNLPGLIASLDAVVDTVKAETALILADTNELQSDNIPGTLATIASYIDTEIATIVADTNELQVDSVPTLIAALDVVVDSIKAETALIVADTNEMQTDLANGGRLDALLDSIKAETALIVADTNELQTDLTDGGRLDALIDLIKVETDKLGDAMPDSIAADGSINTPIQALYMVQQILSEMSVSGTTMTIKKVDGSTTLMTMTLNDAATPTSISRAT